MRREIEDICIRTATSNTTTEYLDDVANALIKTYLKLGYELHTSNIAYSGSRVMTQLTFIKYKQPKGIDLCNL